MALHAVITVNTANNNAISGVLSDHHRWLNLVRTVTAAPYSTTARLRPRRHGEHRAHAPAGRFLHGASPACSSLAVSRAGSDVLANELLGTK